MKKPVNISITTKGVSVLYRCYKFPGHGAKCDDRFTDKCYRCRYAKAEMSASDATKLLRGYK